MSGDGTLRIEIGLRAALIAKAALEMINLEPRICALQLREVVKQVSELDAKLRAIAR